MKHDPIEQITLRSLGVFEAVMQEGSFAEAGRRLGMPRAAVSRVVAQLEEELGAALFERTTRKVVATPVGEALWARLEPTLLTMREELARVREAQEGIAGEVRLSMSHGFGRVMVLPSLLRFQQQHPQIKLEVTLSDTIADLVVESLDLALRLGPLPESSLVARRLGELEVVLVAARALVERCGGAPREVAELSRLPLLGFRIPGGEGRQYVWQLRNAQGETQRFHPPAPVMISDSVESLMDLVKLEAGVCPLPRYLIEEELARGELVRVLPEYELPGTPVHLCRTNKGHEARRVRMLRAHLVEELSARLAGATAS